VSISNLEDFMGIQVTATGTIKRTILCRKVAVHYNDINKTAKERFDLFTSHLIQE